MDKKIDPEYSWEDDVINGAIEYYEEPFIKARARSKKWRQENREREQARKRTPEYLEQRRNYKRDNSGVVRRSEQRRGTRTYHKPFVAIDTEGMFFPGDEFVEHKKLENRDGVEETFTNTYRRQRTILCGAQGWKRTHSATALEDDRERSRITKTKPSLDPTAGAETERYELGDDSKRPLSSLEMMEFLTSLPQKFGPKQGYPDGVNFVSFAFGYDGTQFLADLPRVKVYEIVQRRKFKTNEKLYSPVFWGDFAISYLKGKYFEIWKLRDPKRPYLHLTDQYGNSERKLDSVSHIRIHDAFGFYQESFVKATESLIGLGYVLKDAHDTIAAQKANRDTFDTQPMAAIRHYCGLELVTLAKALTVLRDGFDAMGIRLKAWTGAGQAAAALIKKEDLKSLHYSSDIATCDLTKQQIQAHHAFVGGRIELMRQGYVRNRRLWQYDIASAYPDIMRQLPSMRDGRWKFHGGGKKANSHIRRTAANANMLSMFRVRWHFPDEAADGRTIPFFPFPYRVGHKRGQILFPSHGRAWIMRDEILAACDWVQTLFPHTSDEQISKYFVIEKWSEFIPGNDERPYAFVGKLFDLRWELKREHKLTGVYNILEKAIKLTLNSLYGKTAQA
jgi:hypothetical protein